MRAVLANITDLRGDGTSELMLDRQIPLLAHRRLEVLVGNPDPMSGNAGQIDGRTVRGSSVASSDGPSHVSHGEDSERRVHGELLVGSAAFHEAGNGVAAADHGLAVERRRRPCESKSWLPIASAQVVISQARIAEFRRPIAPVWRIDGAREETEVDHAVLDLRQRSVVFESDAKIQSERICGAPIILHISRVNIAAMLEQRGLKVGVSHSAGRSQTQPEI